MRLFIRNRLSFSRPLIQNYLHAFQLWEGKLTTTRRQLLFFSMSSLFFRPSFAFASGHNAYCVMRDSGGAYLAEKQILIYGSSYESLRPRALASTKPQTVLVETAGDYRTAIRDARSGRLPPGSVAVFDLSRTPEAVIENFATKLGRTSIYYNIPENIGELQNVHGAREFQSGISEARMQASLPELRRVAELYSAMPATKIAPKNGLSAGEWLAQEVEQHGKNDLIIIASHVNKFDVELVSPNGIPIPYPAGQLPLVDGSLFKLARATVDGPTVWVVGCETWELQAGLINLQRSELAFTTKIEYHDSLHIVRLLRTGDTLMEKINSVQKVQWAPRQSQPAPTPTPRPPLEFELEGSHPLPGAPRAMAVIAEATENKVMTMTDKMLA